MTTDQATPIRAKSDPYALVDPKARTMNGHLTWRPELHYSKRGKPWARLGLADGQNRRYEVTCFDDLAAFAASLRPGTEVRVVLAAAPRRRTYVGNDGKRHTKPQRIGASIDVLAEPGTESRVTSILQSHGSNVFHR